MMNPIYGGFKQAPGAGQPITPGATNPFQPSPGGGGMNGPGGTMPSRPAPGQGDPNGNRYQQMRYRRLARGYGGQMTPAGPGAGNINGPGGIQNPFQPNPGVGQINGPGGINPLQPSPGGGQVNGPGGIPPWIAAGAGNMNGPGGIQNPNPGLPKPFPSTPFPGMGGGQIGQQQGYPANQATSNPYMQQFRQPQQQPQQMPANPYNPYQNDWNWNQSGQFPGNRFPNY